MAYKKNLSRRALELIGSLKGRDKIRVLFICLGNICRSPAAEGLMRYVVDEHGASDRWTIDSAGMGGWHVGDLPDKRMRVHAQRRGLTLDHICRQFRETDFDRFDLIIGMDDSNMSDLHRMARTPEDEKKLLPMAEFFVNFAHFDHVPDPYYDGAQGFETVLDLLTDATENLYDTIESERDNG